MAGSSQDEPNIYLVGQPVYPKENAERRSYDRPSNDDYAAVHFMLSSLSWVAEDVVAFFDCSNDEGSLVAVDLKEGGAHARAHVRKFDPARFVNRSAIGHGVYPSGRKSGDCDAFIGAVVTPLGHSGGKLRLGVSFGDNDVARVRRAEVEIDR